MKLSVLFTCIGLTYCVTYGCKQVDKPTPEATIRAFAAAIEKGDFKSAVRMVKGGRADTDFTAFKKQFYSAGSTLQVRIIKTDVQGDKATVTCELLITNSPKRVEEPVPDWVKLDRVNGVWYLTPSEPAHEHSTFGLLASMLMNPTAAVAQSQKPASCLSNIKVLCMGLSIFLADHNDVFKFKADAWKKSIAHYVNNESAFHCPDDKSSIVSYSLNPNLAGKSLETIASPAEVVMVYEGHKLKLDFRHNGNAYVGYVDGHVNAVSPEQAKQLHWKP